MGLVKVMVCLAMATMTTSIASAVTITINNDVATGAIMNGSTILVDGWVRGAFTYRPNPKTRQNELVSTNANKTKIYLFYQQTRPDPVNNNPGSPRIQLDAAFGSDLGPGSGNPDAAYRGTFTANMPDQATTVVTPSCWFFRCEAINDTAAAPNVIVATVEKDVNLVYSGVPK